VLDLEPRVWCLVVGGRDGSREARRRYAGAASSAAGPTQGLHVRLGAFA
jgi:hypothetical protein